MHIPLRWVVAACSLTVALCWTSTAWAECTLGPEARAEIEALVERYRSGWLGKERETVVMALFGRDATILPHHGVRPRQGEKAIRAFWFAAPATSFTINELKMRPLDVSGCGDLAYAWGEQSLDWTNHTGTGDRRFTNEGTFLMVARRHQARHWLIERLMWDDPPNREVTAAAPAR
jgi:uncharacterized protein (TIGR02246 family)